MACWLPSLLFLSETEQHSVTKSVDLRLSLSSTWNPLIADPNGKPIHLTALSSVSKHDWFPSRHNHFRQNHCKPFLERFWKSFPPQLPHSTRSKIDPPCLSPTPHSLPTSLSGPSTFWALLSLQTIFCLLSNMTDKLIWANFDQGICGW